MAVSTAFPASAGRLPARDSSTNSASRVGVGQLLLFGGARGRHHRRKFSIARSSVRLYHSMQGPAPRHRVPSGRVSLGIYVHTRRASWLTTQRGPVRKEKKGPEKNVCTIATGHGRSGGPSGLYDTRNAGCTTAAVPRTRKGVRGCAGGRRMPAPAGSSRRRKQSSRPKEEETRPPRPVAFKRVVSCTQESLVWRLRRPAVSTGPGYGGWARGS